MTEYGAYSERGANAFQIRERFESICKHSRLILTKGTPTVKSHAILVYSASLFATENKRGESKQLLSPETKIKNLEILVKSIDDTNANSKRKITPLTHPNRDFVLS